MRAAATIFFIIGPLFFGLSIPIVIEQTLIHPVSEEQPRFGEAVVVASTILLGLAALTWLREKRIRMRG